MYQNPTKLGASPTTTTPTTCHHHHHPDLSEPQGPKGPGAPYPALGPGAADDGPRHASGRWPVTGDPRRVWVVGPDHLPAPPGWRVTADPLEPLTEGARLEGKLPEMLQPQGPAVLLLALSLPTIRLSH